MPVEEALTALLAGVAGGRRYWGRAEHVSPSAGPYLRLVKVSAPRDYALSGATGYVEARFQIDVFAESYGAAKTTAEAVLSTLSGYSGETAGVYILGIFIDAERDLDATDAGEVSHLFRRSIDIIVHHHE